MTMSDDEEETDWTDYESGPFCCEDGCYDEPKFDGYCEKHRKDKTNTPGTLPLEYKQANKPSRGEADPRDCVNAGTRDSEGAASGGELSEAEIERLRYLAAHVLLGSPADFDERTGLLLRLLDEHRERGERIAELERRNKTLGHEAHIAIANTEAADKRIAELERQLDQAMRVAVTCAHTGYALARTPGDEPNPDPATAALYACVWSYEEQLSAHDPKQGQGGESGA